MAEVNVQSLPLPAVSGLGLLAVRGGGELSGPAGGRGSRDAAVPGPVPELTQSPAVSPPSENEGAPRVRLQEPPPFETIKDRERAGVRFSPSDDVKPGSPPVFAATPALPGSPDLTPQDLDRITLPRGAFVNRLA